MQKSVLLIISGSIAATKSIDLIRGLKEKHIEVRVILTKGGEQFVSRKAVTAAGAKLYTELFSSDEEIAMAHIHLSRQSDLVVVAPASADVIAKMANGCADDLATATLLANNKSLLVAPAMNTHMWIHPATERNVKQIKKDGAEIIEPGEGMLACGETGAGRMAEPEAILEIILAKLGTRHEAQGTLTALVTSGPTHEAIDPVRYLGNRSSGKQGHAIAAALVRNGASVTLVTGPTSEPDPANVRVIHVTTAQEMLAACEKTLPVDVAVCAAAVSDWRVEKPVSRKLKKSSSSLAPALALIENPDIVKTIATHPKKRPALVIGFAAETEALLGNAAQKRKAKNVDWIIANDVSGGKTFGADDNEVTLITAKGNESWPLMSKDKVAEKLAQRIVKHITLSPLRKQGN
jgi:phosphopantothenoylcysteine decarboxylase/phosphopantothenate--cysteine ligase